MARRGRGRGRGRGRPKKKVIESDDDEQIIETTEAIDNLVEIPEDEPNNEKLTDKNVITHSGPAGGSKKHAKAIPAALESDEDGRTPTKCDYNIDDISQLVAPTFSTLNLAPPQPMIDLSWDHKYISLGERIPSPNVHFCEICRLPVRIYGRMIPCKHIFCYKCACDSGPKCPRCGDKVHRVETSQLGSVFMCSHEGSRYGFDGCRRTYLSQRDLLAHINHRHKPRSGEAPSPGVSSSNVPAAADTSQRSGSGSFSRSPYSSAYSPRSSLVSVPQAGSHGSSSYSKYGTSPEMPSSSSRYDRRRGSQSSQIQHEISSRNKWSFR